MDLPTTLFLLGRLLYGGYFVFSGINHFAKNEALAGYAASKKVPVPKLAVYLSGLLILLGGLGILLGIYIKISILYIVIFLVVVSFMMHNFWSTTDPMSKMMDMTQFMKNMALLGAALLLLSIPEPWMASIL